MPGPFTYRPEDKLVVERVTTERNREGKTRGNAAIRIAQNTGEEKRRSEVVRERQVPALTQ